MITKCMNEGVVNLPLIYTMANICPHAKLHRGLLVSKYVVTSDDTRLNFNLSLYMHGYLVDGKLNTTK